MKKKLLMPVFMFFVMLFAIPSFGHGGGIDANGGHHDYNNVSGLGSYHYHCDGHSAHLHTDGVCPFSSDASTSSYASQLAKKEPVESDFNSAGRKDTKYIAENSLLIETKKTEENIISGLFDFIEQHSFTILICNFFIWITLRSLGKKIIREELFLDKYFFIRRLIVILHYANWAFACIVLLLTTEDPPPR